MFDIPKCSEHLSFAQNIIFYPENYEFDTNSVVTNNIPKIIHLIWVGENDPPSYFNLHFRKWKELMPDWELRVWRNEDITLQHFPEDIIQLLKTVKKGAQQADIMRYFIMEKYGGVYLDSDITPHKTLESLIQIPDAKVILCHDLELTWQYISIGFFAAEPNHPLFKLCAQLCYAVKLNTEDVHMQTGPRLLGEAVSRITDNKIILLPTKFFYRNETYDGRFGHHFYAKQW